MYLSTNRYLVVLVALVVAASPHAASARVAPPSVGCESCLVLDATSGEVLFARNARVPLPNASTTKMMTALLVVEAAGPRELVHVSAEAAAVGGGGLDLSTGDVYTVRDLLYALLLDSSNEAAAALSIHVEGDTASFVAAMNRKARALGARDTRFTNPHGLDAAGHRSTARDLATIGLALLEQPQLARIVATPSRAIATPGGTEVVENRNALLEGYKGAIGVKTGQTLGAGEVLVAAARRDGRFILTVAMRSQDAAADSRQLLDYGFSRLRAAAAEQRRRERAAAAEEGVVLAIDQHVGALVFDPGGATGVVAAAEVSARGELRDDVSIVFTPSEELLLPLERGEEIGTVQVMSGDELLGTVPALADDAVEVEDPSWGTRALTGLLRTAAVVMEGIAA